ncbi:MAG TPA: nitroreductase family protein [Acidimicrobiales bacterium]|jgi:nitroreductase|nr:nitroreductase family protein [Acidimicrobiales bacterium]
MDFQDVVRRRRMVRNFDPDRPVDEDVRERILANALRGPSAGFSQGFEFLACESAASREQFWRTTWPEGHDDDLSHLVGMRRAPLLVVALSNKTAYLDRYAEPDKGWTDRDEARWPVPYWDIDTGFAALLMLLTVVDEGLGACFFGISPERIPRFRESFGIPASYLPIGALAIGHRAPDAPSPSIPGRRRATADVVHVDRWAPRA